MAVQGWCLTIGIELMLASDICVAAPDARFAQMEVRRGIMAFGGATLRLHRVAGWGNAMRWLLTGGEFDATEAHRIGLVQEVSRPDGALDAAIAIAEEVAAQAPLAVQASRSAALTAIQSGQEAALGQLMTAARGLMTTADAREGVMSFMERREAVFTGK